jgi:hypothetical protein
MTDYHLLISRAVSALDKSTGEARRALYEHARNTLVVQLRGFDPPLTETTITRERLSLEDAIRKVETESARRCRPGPPPIRPPADPTKAEIGRATAGGLRAIAKRLLIR